MKKSQSHIDSKKRTSGFVNPFIKMIEDKKRIGEAIKDGKPLAALKEIVFVKAV